MGSMVMTETRPPEAQGPEVLKAGEFRARCAELEARLRLRAGQLAALQARFLADLADYDDLRGWAAWGTRSVADWLSNHCGHGSYLAHAELTLAHELEELPRIRAAFESGALSMDKAKALASVASAETEEELLGFAREATANQLARALGAAKRSLGRQSADHLRRSRQLITYWDDEGAQPAAGLVVDGGDGPCQLDEGAALCSDTLRRLACGASFMWLLEDERGKPLAVSETTQPSLPRRLRRAVRARDGGCVFPNGA